MGKLVEPKVTHREGRVLLRARGHLNLPEARLEVHLQEMCYLALSDNIAFLRGLQVP